MPRWCCNAATPENDVKRSLTRWLLPAALLAALLHTAGTARADIDLGPRVSLDADDASLPAVLKILAEKGNLNIVTGPGVAAGHVTIHLKDVPVEQAVNLVVRAAGLAYERIGTSILVAEAKKLQVDTGGNRLIIVTSPRVISEIQHIIAEMDKPARQVMLEARVVEVSTDGLKKLGIDWDLLNRQGFTFVEGTY